MPLILIYLYINSYCFDNSVDAIALCQDLLTTITSEDDKGTSNIHTYAIREIVLLEFGIHLNKVKTKKKDKTIRKLLSGNTTNPPTQVGGLVVIPLNKTNCALGSNPNSGSNPRRDVAAPRPPIRVGGLVVIPLNKTNAALGSNPP
jgi:hypothetical protein